MKAKTSYLFFALLILLLSSCAEKMEPCINADIEHPEPGQVVTYTNCLENLPGDWDFGDGSPQVSGTVVTHTYSTAGPYTLTLSIQRNDIEWILEDTIIVGG